MKLFVMALCLCLLSACSSGNESYVRWVECKIGDVESFRSKPSTWRGVGSPTYTPLITTDKDTFYHIQPGEQCQVLSGVQFN